MAENTIIHEIRLAGYKATSTGGMLDLGTWGSYGIEKLHLTLDAAWQDLTITAFFNVNGEVVAKRVVGKDGYADVPWEATKKNTFSGCLAFEGSINGQRRISTNLNYKVTNHSETTDSDPVPTDDRWNQFVTETKGYRDGAFEAAEKANTRAEDAETASEDAQAAARAAKASENAAAASASNAAASADKAGPYAKAAQAAQEAAENAAAAAAASKSAADTLAAEAARAAQAAENSKAAASNAAYFAGENATAAQKAAATATAAANDAGQSASAAAASKAAAETAAKAAQNAQTATAAAKAEAVKAQGAAQTAAKSAQDAQAAAENVRDDAQTAQQGAEAARDAAAKSAEAAAKSEANAKQSADTLAESVENVVANTAAVAELKQQVKNITPDDSSIGDNPWSSKHIIDMLCPPLEESGNPVVCYPVAGYALGVKAMWEPAQEGTGTPSPENIRPIKGRDSVTVDRCGENVIEFLSTEDSSSDIKIAVDAEKNITLNGTLAGKGNITIGTCRLHWVAGKTYTMYVKKVGGSVSLGSGDGITFAYALFTTDYNHFFRGGTNSTNLDVYIASDAALVETELVFMLQCWRKGTVFNNFKFQIEVVEGTTTPSTYKPYNGQTNTLTLPETVYGGEVDAVSGEGQETWKTLTLDGTEKWDKYGNVSEKAGASCFYFSIDDKDIGYGTSVCNKFVNTKNSNPFNSVNMKKFTYTDHPSIKNIYMNYGDDQAVSVDEWKAYLAAQYSAGTPVQIAYKLAEPVPFTATGAQPIPALAGANTVLTDADSATVTGRADPIKRITDLEDAAASQT